MINEKNKKSIWRRWWLWAIIIIIVVIIFSAGDDKIENIPKEVKKPEVQEQQVNQGPFSSLAITDVSVSGGEVVILGNTDLPDGATLSIGFDVWGRSGSDLYIGVSKKTIVSNSKFEETLRIPQREEFGRGPYEVSVLFTPRGQSDEIINFVGGDGENLIGGLVNESVIATFKTLKLIKKIDAQIAIVVPSYIFQQPVEFVQGSAERTLAGYVSAWGDQDWNKMASFAQKTWLSNQIDPVELLGAWYDFKDLKGFEIIGVEKISTVVNDITFVVQYEFITNQISKKKIVARIIKETDSFALNEQGQWGVNPTSALREEDMN